jgi:hypothetical protein
MFTLIIKYLLLIFQHLIHLFLYMHLPSILLSCCRIIKVRGNNEKISIVDICEWDKLIKIVTILIHSYSLNVLVLNFKLVVVFTGCFDHSNQESKHNYF